MRTIPRYGKEVIEYIEGVQKHKLFLKFGPDFKNIWNKLLPKDEGFLDHIEKTLEDEFQNNFNERFTLEAQLKNSALEEVTNRTKYEFRELKAVVNFSELKYRYCVSETLLAKTPYNATAYSGAPNAEIISPPELDKPIIFFDVELLSANLMFCKLYIQLICENPPPNTIDRYKYFTVNDDDQAIRTATLSATYFYNHYFSSTSKENPHYDVKSSFKNSILAVFLDTMGYYIYSHEVGHYVLNHSMSTGGRATEQLWQDEFEADAFAMDRMKELHKANEQSTILNFLGPLIFYRYLMLSELYKPGIMHQNTHPPTINRVESYWRWLFKHHRPTHHQYLSSFLMEEQKLFEILCSIFKRIHEEAKK